MISIPSSSSFPVGNSITRLITSCVCRNGQQMANARAPALIDARNLAPAKRRPDHYFLFLSLSLLSFSPCFPFFFFLLQKGYCIATYTYSADWPSQVAISGTEAVIFYPFVTLLTLFFRHLSLQFLRGQTGGWDPLRRNPLTQLVPMSGELRDSDGRV